MFKNKKRKIELEKLGGCEKCTRNCRRNGNIAIPDVAKRTKNKPFRCNNTHPEYGKNSKINKETK